MPANAYIKINGTDKSSDIYEDLISVEVDQSLFLPNMLTIHLNDEIDRNTHKYKWADSDTFALGKPVEIEVETDEIEDFVILRSDGSSTYHLSVVVDDSDMRISHVVRGVDHLTNTSKHVLLYQALGKTVPVFCHLPLILGTDKKRLSKRHGATSVLEYRQQGFLPEAVRNYLAELGLERDRFETVGFGETRPIADNETEEGRQRNRRTEFRVLD